MVVLNPPLTFADRRRLRTTNEIPIGRAENWRRADAIPTATALLVPDLTGNRDGNAPHH
ncbi:hypothetical protein GCM10025867_23860 [Frondihabitans sucicola]|uniref:Uncharacterized protein n=1 Tax=Frondihabitans sucicola TaxID=1268041 RepID=A0ABN6Y2N5_9MICO|nr:hypothetical protein [Frondihabitans sucicola]BDZ50145.1 hypothetical protein GCM10025867_23860 [Frondihabitans sucicola]